MRYFPVTAAHVNSHERAESHPELMKELLNPGYWHLF